MTLLFFAYLPKMIHRIKQICPRPTHTQQIHLLYAIFSRKWLLQATMYNFLFNEFHRMRWGDAISGVIHTSNICWYTFFVCFLVWMIKSASSTQNDFLLIASGCIGFCFSVLSFKISITLPTLRCACVHIKRWNHAQSTQKK